MMKAVRLLNTGMEGKERETFKHVNVKAISFECLSEKNRSANKYDFTHELTLSKNIKLEYHYRRRTNTTDNKRMKRKVMSGNERIFYCSTRSESDFCSISRPSMIRLEKRQLSERTYRRVATRRSNIRRCRIRINKGDTSTTNGEGKRECHAAREKEDVKLHSKANVRPLLGHQLH
jgi:hypothetical protein